MTVQSVAIKGFDEYTISSDGKVFSKKKNKYLIGSLVGIGYKSVSLWKNRKGFRSKIHRLVAQHFIVNSENKNCVNHIDGNKLNNTVDNLEWVTQKENVQHAFRTGLQHNRYPRPGKRKKIVAYKDGVEEVFEGVAMAAKEMGILHTSIANCLAGRSNYAGGYVWRYLN